MRFFRKMFVVVFSVMIVGLIAAIIGSFQHRDRALALRQACDSAFAAARTRAESLQTTLWIPLLPQASDVPVPCRDL